MEKKNLFRTAVCALVLLVCSMSGYAKGESLSGVWNYTASDAPYGYESGLIEFKQVDGQLKAVLTINGSVVATDKVVKQGDVHIYNTNLEYVDVKVVFKQADGKLTATAEADGQTFHVTFTPKQ